MVVSMLLPFATIHYELVLYREFTLMAVLSI